MRILHILGSLNRGGAESWLVQVLRHIDRVNYQFDFAVHTNDPSAYDDEVRCLGARIISCLSPSRPIQYARNLRTILKEFGPYDCVHSHVHHYSGYTLAVSAMCGVPIRIAHSHNDTSLVDDNSYVLRRLYLTSMESLIRRYATAGLAVSERAARSLFGSDWRSDERWKISHLGIDLQTFRNPKDSRKIRMELGIPAEAFVIGHVGRFFKQKNHSFLIQIAAETIGICPNTFLVLVGDGPLRDQIESQTEELGIRNRVLFLGVRNDIQDILASFDVFVLPSLFEGFGLVLLEAQASGLPCVFSDCVPTEADVVKELVTRKTLVESADTWARTILQAGSASRNDVTNSLSEFDISTSTRRLTDRYDSLAIATARPK